MALYAPPFFSPLTPVAQLRGRHLGVCPGFPAARGFFWVVYTSRWSFFFFPPPLSLIATVGKGVPELRIPNPTVSPSSTLFPPLGAFQEGYLDYLERPLSILDCVLLPSPPSTSNNPSCPRYTQIFWEGGLPPGTRYFFQDPAFFSEMLRWCRVLNLRGAVF